jgi:LAS superfamily LD-carboxypeptidase LdcB
MAGNIIGDSFDAYVKEQILIRQEKLGLGLKSQEVLQFESSNTPFIRLTSGVDVDDTVLKNLGLSNNSLYKGKGLATYNQLYSGRSVYASKDLTDIKFDFTKGYGYFDGTLGQQPTSYGFYSNPDYGLVPPPGIKSVDIKALNRGSLREANIEIQCHNLQQFQILEVLYMRLKYSILLEWGHSVYFDNNGNFQQSRHNLSGVFLLGGITQQGMLNKIKEERNNSDGNYDAFFGLVTNFSWTLRPDGGYDITVTARSMGDIIESLKINTSYPVKQGTSVPTPQTPAAGDPPVPSMQANYYKTTINRILSILPIHIYPGRNYAHGVDQFYNGNNGAYFAVNNKNLAAKTGLTAVFNRDKDESKSSNFLTWNEVVCWVFDNLEKGAYSSNGGKRVQYYLKLGTLLRILESFLMYYDITKTVDSAKGTETGNAPLVKIDYNYNDNFCLTFPRQASTNPKVCLIPIDSAPITGATSGTITTKISYDFIKPYPGEQGVIITNTPDYYNKYAPFFGSATISKNTFSAETTAITIGETAYYLTGSSDLENIVNTSGGVYTYAIDSLLNRISNGLSNAPAMTIEASTLYLTGIVNDPLEPMYFYDGTNPDNLASRAKLANGSPLADIRIDGSVQKITQYQYQWAKDQQARVEQQAGQRFSSPFSKVNANKQRYVVQSFVDGGSAYSPTPNSDGVYDSIKDSGFRTPDKTYIGNLMHMYVNAEYISGLLDENVDDNGRLSLYNFLNGLMKGIQSALGNVNNFEVIYNEEQNTFRIIDNTFIPGLSESAKSISQFNANILKNNYGSFVKNVNFKTKLSNNFATMTTIGAQKNGNVVGSNSTALSKWNTGLTDRIIPERDNPNGIGTEKVETAYLNNINRLTDFNNKVNKRKVTEADITNVKGAISDIFNSEVGEFATPTTEHPNGKIPGIGFIPFDLELVMLGLSGPRIYESYTIDTTLLPEVYKNKIQFICSGVSHHIDVDGWVTTLNSICGPKYADITVVNADNVSNYTSIDINQNNNGGGEENGSNGRLPDSALKDIGIGNNRLAIAAADAFIQMKAAMDAAGIQYNLTDSYRTFDVQDSIFDWDLYVATGGNRSDTAANYNRNAERKKKDSNGSVNAAFPGTSNHGLGLAIDIFPPNNNQGINVQKWIRENGVNYGWSWTEGKAAKELWHFTYYPNDSRVYTTDWNGNPI